MADVRDPLLERDFMPCETLLLRLEEAFAEEIKLCPSSFSSAIFRFNRFSASECSCSNVSNFFCATRFVSKPSSTSTSHSCAETNISTLDSKNIRSLFSLSGSVKSAR